jgi:hypothetical protein
MDSYANLPKSASVDIQPYKIEIDPLKVQSMEILIRAAPVGPETYENTQTEQYLGLNRKWFEDIKNKWVNDFKWLVASIPLDRPLFLHRHRLMQCRLCI